MWFNEMVATIRQAKKLCFRGHPGRVMNRSTAAGKGTLQQDSSIATKSLYRSEYAGLARASIRKTASAIGVSPTTVHRWANRYFLECGSRIALKRGAEALARLEARIEARAIGRLRPFTT